ncbi:MAG: GTP-binding protein, partial [Lachnospiraceae bacterium]|nr:GTP-binding protein [Lachnospiraceae bacterium]
EHHHHHHHEDGEECHCHDHDHEHEHGHHHHHHHADEVFENWGKESPRKYTEEELKNILSKLENSIYGIVLRAKGIVCTPEGKWLQFDYVPGEFEIREGTADYTGRFCVIGSKLDREALEELF